MPRKTDGCRAVRGVVFLASMRPRPDAAENHPNLRDRLFSPEGFNEAAARCRGKPSSRRWRSPAACRFNEAAARCRGKPLSSIIPVVTEFASLQ